MKPGNKWNRVDITNRLKVHLAASSGESITMQLLFQTLEQNKAGSFQTS